MSARVHRGRQAAIHPIQLAAALHHPERHAIAISAFARVERDTLELVTADGRRWSAPLSIMGGDPDQLRIVEDGRSISMGDVTRAVEAVIEGATCGPWRDLP